MSITDKTRKLLWGRSGSRCAFCRTQLIMDSTPHDDESVVGEECHIVSRRPSGPRHLPAFPPDEIDSYDNLLLLCRTHHKMVDDQLSTFTPEALHQLKGNHEAWVAETLEQSSSGYPPNGNDPLAEAFRKVASRMPDLIAEMKEDLAKKGNEFIREFFIISKRWSLNAGSPSFVYSFEDHENLQGKVHVLENYGFVYDVTPGNAKKYRMTEEFVELVVSRHEDQLRLWTVHPPGFSLTEGRVDHSKSKYYCDTHGVKDAYHELWHRRQIPDGQVVWCYTDEGSIERTGEKKVKWDLYDPSLKTICFIDDLVWNRILGIKCGFRDGIEGGIGYQWHKDALEKFPNDLKASKAYEARCFEDFWSQEPKSGNWWNELFTENAGNGVSALIRHPIPSKWIHGSMPWHCG